MASPDRETVFLPDGKAMMLTVGVQAYFAWRIKDEDGTPRDLTSDTPSIAAKDDIAVRTLTVANRANQTTTGKGYVDVTVPAAQVITGGGTMLMDIKLTRSGLVVENVAKLQATIEESETT